MKNLNGPVLVQTCPIFSHDFILFYEENWKVWPYTRADFLLGRALALDQGFSFGLKGNNFFLCCFVLYYIIFWIFKVTLATF